MREISRVIPEELTWRVMVWITGLESPAKSVRNLSMLSLRSNSAAAFLDSGLVIVLIS
jgi:hypothetical protein